MGNSNLTINITVGTIIKLIIVGILFYIGFILLDLLLVLLTAVVIASGVTPITNWLTSKNIPRLLAVVLIYFFIAVLCFGASYFLIIPLMQETLDFLRNMPDYFSQLEVWNPLNEEGFIGGSSVLTEFSSSFSIQELINQINDLVSNLTSGFLNTLSVIFGGILSFILIVVLSFYLSVQKNGVRDFLKIISPDSQENYIINLWDRAEKKIGYWMQGQIVLALMVGVLTYLGLLLLGVNHALLLAFLAATFELIPIFGSILAAVPAIAIAFVDGGITLALLVTGFYIIVQQLESQLIYPLIVRKVVGVSPIIVIISLIAGFQLAGFLGVILSVPISTVITEFFDDMQKISKKRKEAEIKV